VPQFEIVIEPDDCLHEEEVSDDFKTEEEKLKAFERMVQEGKAGTLQGLLEMYQHVALRIVYWLCILNQSVVTLSLRPCTSPWKHVYVV
jgi:hypothetical protein